MPISSIFAPKGSFSKKIQIFRRVKKFYLSLWKQRIMKKLTWHEMFHLERLELGTKFIRSGKHTSNSFHDHIYSELAIVLKSDGVIHRADGKSHQLVRGDVVLIHPGKIHGYENADSLEIFNILYIPEKLPLPPLDGSRMKLFNTMIMPQSDTARTPEKPLLTLNENELQEITAAALQLQKELESDLLGKNLRSFGLFINLLTLICRCGGGEIRKEHTNSLAASIHYLNTHFRERPDVNFLAHRANMSRRGFFRRFREETGMSPRQYILHKSLSAAEEMLLKSDLSLSEIAYECGFYDSNHFSRLFKSAYKLSPGKFRRENRAISIPENEL
jgi:AraC-like DNA-binding protein/mannose-6-phosphate isomerase-like protein (cupin superfamily)